ncbi:glycosyltransferase family 4 protein, partial [Patescibacteria group bacterium]|nr:glycosyltransferase family 4 protein [Patescibacteria group bacterium]
KRSKKEIISYGFGILIKPIKNFFTIRKFIRENKIDIIQIVPTSHTFIPLIISAILSKKPVIIDIRDYSLMCPMSFNSKRYQNGSCDHNCSYCTRYFYKTKSKIINFFGPVFAFYELSIFKINRFILKLLIEKSNDNKFVAISGFIKNKLIEWDYPKNKIEVIPNIANIKSRSNKNKERENKIIFAGRVEKDKGIWDCINAFEILEDKKLKFEIAGDGSQIEQIKNYIERQNLKNIKLLGKIPNEKVLKLYSQSKIILSPSIWPEPFGRFIQEGISTRTPVIATKVGGIPEGIKDRETGLLVEPNNPRQLAKAIKELLSDKKLYNKIVKNLGREAKKYSPEAIGNQRLALFDKILKKQNITYNGGSKIFK